MNTQDTNRRIRLIMHLRTAGITDTNVLGAMEKIPRDAFVPAAVKDQAWDDIALPIGRGQTISQPFVEAAMTQALNLSDRDKVLEKVMKDPRLAASMQDPKDMPFDGKRMIYGGFKPLVKV